MWLVKSVQWVLCLGRLEISPPPKFPPIFGAAFFWKNWAIIRPLDWMPYFFRLRNSGFTTSLCSYRSVCLSVSFIFHCLVYFYAIHISNCLSMSLCLCLFLSSRSQSQSPWRFFYQYLCLPLFLFSSFFKISHVPVKHFEQKTNFTSNQRLYFFPSFYYNIFSTKWNEKRFFCFLPKLSCLSCDSTKSGW